MPRTGNAIRNHSLLTAALENRAAETADRRADSRGAFTLGKNARPSRTPARFGQRWFGQCWIDQRWIDKRGFRNQAGGEPPERGRSKTNRRRSEAPLGRVPQIGGRQIRISLTPPGDVISRVRPLTWPGEIPE